ncbi:leucine-rich repeat-containing protein 25 [Phyllostomus hastatus]|uniref:leucine-rich repeat-containing protein 25 n=1 Tax=Phyllostomus hastatus TaxID=9423 RepID=UPI001E67EAC5|nr:leucine-rich repeat-containing protein 25 [Phyllostomus hastatus]XP_045709142.1 leucine-rich repeat-containing protein 25 [Phyllostomus hastatus]XP_045709144.1 leucine-rich repeat-containing protein 25 [Phyllostomus hastatus]
MGGALAWAPWLLLLLQDPCSLGLSCNVSLDVGWSREFKAPCLNFSGQHLSLPPNKSLQAIGVRLLDLSANELRELPQPFFNTLHNLQILNVTYNPLEHVPAMLAELCSLDLKANCLCALAPWHKVRQDKNCSDPPLLQCLDERAGTWHNLSTFLESGCPPGLSSMTIGVLAASGSLLLGLFIAGSLLAWRFRARWAPSSQGLGKTWAAADGPRSGSGRQPRYSSRNHSPKQPADTLPRPPTPDYENVFAGQPPAEHQWTKHGAHPSEDNDLYMNYESLPQAPQSPCQASQPIYGNLQFLGHTPPVDEEYVTPGH